jgi:hypothetical protein
MSGHIDGDGDGMAEALPPKLCAVRAWYENVQAPQALATV